MNITHNLRILHSRRDFAGNCYWAFEMTDLDTGRTIQARTTGGEDNTNQIRFDWKGPGTGWTNEIQYRVYEMGIRDFNRYVKDWAYAGCHPDDIRKWCKTEFAKPERTNAVVIFRKWKDTGDIVALFPEMPGTNAPDSCESYMHVGQHGSAQYRQVIQATSPCQPEECAALKRELEGLGYYLTIRKRRST